MPYRHKLRILDCCAGVAYVVLHISERSLLAIKRPLISSTGDHLWEVDQHTREAPYGAKSYTLLHYGSTQGRLLLEVLLCVIP